MDCGGVIRVDGVDGGLQPQPAPEILTILQEERETESEGESERERERASAPLSDTNMEKTLFGVNTSANIILPGYYHCERLGTAS